MTLWIMLWIIAALLFLIIDMIWLLWIGRGFYVDEIGILLRGSPNFAAAGAFYALYVTGLLIMVLIPAHQAQSVSHALLHGAVFGLVAYGTYDLTNLAVMKGFTLKIALIDMAWGTALTAGVAAITIWLSRLLPA